MDKELLTTTPVAQRAEILRDSCYKVFDDVFYSVELTEEEILERKSLLAEKMKRIKTLKEELKEIQRSIRTEIKDLYEISDKLVEAIHTKKESRRGTLYAFDDQEEGVLGLYDSNGKLVEARPLTMDERQTSILTIKPTGTDTE